MAKDQSALLNWSQYLGARCASMALTMFDVEANLRTAAQIGRIMYSMDKRHRDRAAHAIRMSFPDWDEARVQQTVQASFEHFVQLAIEVLHTPRLMTHDAWPNHTQFRNLGPAIKALADDKPAILLTGHLGNWEVLGFLLAVLGYDLDALARPIDNPLINDWLLGIREMRGMRIITKWDATERMLGVLDRGGALAFIADQNAGEKGMFVPFFGRLASTYKSIGLLAIQYDCPVICGYAHRIGPGFRFEVGVADMIQPEDWADKRDPLYYITARYNRALETMVRMRPEQYLWMHRRWKSRPRHEKLGKPMNSGLRRNLEELPWMTDDLMTSLQHPPEPPPS